MAIYVREDIPSLAKNDNFPWNVEAILVEINLRKAKLILVGAYHSTNKEYGCSDDVFLQHIGVMIDKYSSYDKFLIAGDLNMQEGQVVFDNFLEVHQAKNLVKEPTCYKSPQNPSCIDWILTNRSSYFKNTKAIDNNYQS